MKRLFIFILFFILTCLITSCTFSQLKDRLIELGAIPPDHTSEYLEIYHKTTKNLKIYSEFETKAIISVTPFTPSFLEAYLQERKLFLKEADFLQLEERERQIQEKNFKFFVSFYTPNPDFNDLDKSNSVWQIYIEKSHTKILPLAIRKSTEPYPILNHFFPNLDPWSYPYLIIFPKFKDNMPLLEKGEEYRLVFKSVLGEAVFTFTNQ